MYKKHLVATLFIGAFINFSSKAQEHQKISLEERAELRSKAMQQELGLDSPQYLKILNQNIVDARNFKLLHTTKGSPIVKARQTLKLKQDRENVIKNILTAEQYKTYQKIKTKLSDNDLD